MPASTTLEILALLAFAGILIAAAVSDARRLVLPNRYSVAIVLLYPAYALAAAGQVDWLGALALAGGCFVVGFLLFSMRVFGGGDAKLLTACSLWAGPALFPEFLFGTALVGGLLAVAFIVHRRWAGSLAGAAHGAAGGVVQADGPASTKRRWAQPLPYGVAIAVGGLQVAVMLFLGR
jgi:prepilin peptidase CpaA